MKKIIVKKIDNTTIFIEDVLSKTKNVLPAEFKAEGNCNTGMVYILQEKSSRAYIAHFSEIEINESGILSSIEQTVKELNSFIGNFKPGGSSSGNNGSDSAKWGKIVGNIEEQIDLIEKLKEKQDKLFVPVGIYSKKVTIPDKAFDSILDSNGNLILVCSDEIGYVDNNDQYHLITDTQNTRNYIFLGADGQVYIDGAGLYRVRSDNYTYELVNSGGYGFVLSLMTTDENFVILFSQTGLYRQDSTGVFTQIKPNNLSGVKSVGRREDDMFAYDDHDIYRILGPGGTAFLGGASIGNVTSMESDGIKAYFANYDGIFRFNLDLGGTVLINTVFKEMIGSIVGANGIIYFFGNGIVYLVGDSSVQNALSNTGLTPTFKNFAAKDNADTYFFSEDGIYMALSNQKVDKISDVVVVKSFNDFNNTVFVQDNKNKLYELVDGELLETNVSLNDEISKGIVGNNDNLYIHVNNDLYCILRGEESGGLYVLTDKLELRRIPDDFFS